MKYLEFTFRIEPNEQTYYEILTAILGTIGFDGFVDNKDQLLAYIQQGLFKVNLLRQSILDFPFDEAKISYTTKELEDKNWNKEWEKNFFQPQVINDQCIIYSTFHTHIPQKKYNIIINPQMSFGTGHHETTYLMLQSILGEDFENRTVLDMGCGTAILSILAKKKGAKQITAIDIDSWCINNSKENITLNNLSNIDVLQGDAMLLKSYTRFFDVIFANINRNILLNDMKKYISSLKPNGILHISGFYEADAPLLREEAAKLNLYKLDSNTKNKWMMIKFQKREK